MRPSLLLLDDISLDELSFSLDDEYSYNPEKGEEPKPLPSDLDVSVEPFRHPEEPQKWYFKLGVRLDNKQRKFPYTFAIRLSGLFEVSKDCPANLTDQLPRVNAPSILYASARELLALVTSRSRYLTVFLPSITFYEPPSEKQATEAPKETARKSAGKSGHKPKTTKKGSKGGGGATAA